MIVQIFFCVFINSSRGMRNTMTEQFSGTQVNKLRGSGMRDCIRHHEGLWSGSMCCYNFDSPFWKGKWNTQGRREGGIGGKITRARVTLMYIFLNFIKIIFWDTCIHWNDSGMYKNGWSMHKDLYPQGSYFLSSLFRHYFASFSRFLVVTRFISIFRYFLVIFRDFYNRLFNSILLHFLFVFRFILTNFVNLFTRFSQFFGVSSVCFLLVFFVQF